MGLLPTEALMIDFGAKRRTLNFFFAGVTSVRSGVDEFVDENEKMLFRVGVPNGAGTCGVSVGGFVTRVVLGVCGVQKLPNWLGLDGECETERGMLNEAVRVST
jgi:hypothetical protein